jgi:hypothetical protein
MLEKIAGCALITKLQSILLMEADFNATNKIIYGNRMLQTVREHGLMPEEIYSEHNRLADDGTLAKVLFYDIVRQTRRPAEQCHRIGPLRVSRQRSYSMTLFGRQDGLRE